MALEGLFPFSINETSLGSKVNCNRVGRRKKEIKRKKGEREGEGGKWEGGRSEGRREKIGFRILQFLAIRKLMASGEGELFFFKPVALVCQPHSRARYMDSSNWS